jgi:hypothetical protein
MKIRGQMVTAAAATASLFTATSGIFLSGGSRISFAEPLTADAVAALQAAVTNPTSDLTAVLAQMDTQQPGSSAQFVSALQSNTDTTALATALQQLVTANAALQTTITTALTTLAAAPSLASLGTTGGNFLNLPNLVSANGPVLTSTPPSPPVLASNNPNPQSGNPSVPSDPSLPNPSAPGPSPVAGLTPFTRPGQNPTVDPGHNPPGPPTDLPSHGDNPNAPVNPGRGNSRA